MMPPTCPLTGFACTYGCALPCIASRPSLPSPARTFGVWMREPTAGDLVDLCRNMSDVDDREIFALRDHHDRDRLAMEIYALLPRAFAAHAIGLDSDAAAIAFLGLWPQDESAGLLSANLFGTGAFPSLAGRLARWVRAVMIPGLLRMGVRRVECRALAEHSGARAFIRACGAIEEAELPDLGKDGETYVLCAWRRSDYVHLQNP